MDEHEAIEETLKDVRENLDDARRVVDYLEFLKENAIHRVQLLEILIKRLESF